MDAERLRYFLTAARTQHIRMAAELVHLSPAGLSKAIKSLEAEVGRALFVADGRRVRLTEAGVLLAGEAQRLIDEWERVTNRLSGVKSAPRLRLGGFEVFTTYMLGELSVHELTDMAVEVHELTPGRLEAAIADRRVDIGITYIPIPHPDLEFQKVTSITMGVFGLRRFHNIAWQDLPFVIPTTPLTGTPTKVSGLDGWPDDLLPRRVAFHAGLMESALELCRRGLAVMYLPTFVAMLHNENVKEALKLEAIPMPSLPATRHRQDVWIVQRKDIEDRTPALKIARRLRMVCSARRA